MDKNSPDQWEECSVGWVGVKHLHWLCMFQWQNSVSPFSAAVDNCWHLHRPRVHRHIKQPSEWTSGPCAMFCFWRLDMREYKGQPVDQAWRHEGSGSTAGSDCLQTTAWSRGVRPLLIVHRGVVFCGHWVKSTTSGHVFNQILIWLWEENVDYCLVSLCPHVEHMWLCWSLIIIRVWRWD